MKLVIVSGLSGSGKTVALHALEDQGYYCIDNLHLGLVTAVVQQLMSPRLKLYDRAAVGIDARSGVDELERFPQILAELRGMDIDVEVIFFQADVNTLLKRFSETRRKHPLARKGIPLIEAIHVEKTLLGHVAAEADLIVDTTRTNVHELTALVRERVAGSNDESLSLLFQSFGYKHGAPADSDYVFDIRCLPNPHWEPRLRQQTGRDPGVVEYLEGHPLVEEMYGMLRDFLETWIPRFEAENRCYLSVSVGCTGGQHRSVYMVERLARHFRQGHENNVSIRHRELS
ncbi:MAG TPA: RNase adapter RapZ [Thioalkalivibrio sp.]|nr:RNase adapter RapZ [Thioalkalivibrio sp.]